MINVTDMGEICLRREHSAVRLGNGGAASPSPASKAAAENRPKVDFFDEVAGGARTPNGRSEREANRIMERAITYMLHNLDKPIQMATLGTLAGVSMSHFYHLFKLATGCTPNDFLIRARIRRAGELLRETDLSVKEISAVLGYDDPFYFSRVFKSVSSVSPREYRVMTAEAERAPGRPGLDAFERKTFETPAQFPSEPQRVRQNHAARSRSGEPRKTVCT